MLLTRLELFLRRENIGPVEFGRKAGYTRMQVYRLRMGKRFPTRAAILAAMGAAWSLSGKRVLADTLFERGSLLLEGRGQRLSEMHVADRRKLKAALAALAALDHIHDASPLFLDRIRASEVASETGVRFLLEAGEALLVTNPEAAATVFEGAARMSETLRNTPRELVQSLEGHGYKGRANALNLLGNLDDALRCLLMASERFSDAVYCNDEAGQADYTRAAILLELEQWDEALEAVRSAHSRFTLSANTRFVAKSEVLEAIILFELGDMDGAHDRWLRLTGVFAALRQRNDLAKVWLNLGNCEIRRNHPVEARRWLALAHDGFRKLGNGLELARTRWNMGTYAATFHNTEPQRALRHWTTAYRGFLALRVWLDAGCVGLDMLETMLDAGTPDEELTFHANSAADALSRVPGIGQHIASALDQLRRIVNHEDRHRVVRMVRAALSDAKANCNEIAVAPVAVLGGAAG